MISNISFKIDKYKHLQIDQIINKEKSIFRIVKTIYSLMNNSYSFVLREGNTKIASKN